MGIFTLSFKTIIAVAGNWAVFFLSWVVAAGIIGAIEKTKGVSKVHV